MIQTGVFVHLTKRHSMAYNWLSLLIIALILVFWWYRIVKITLYKWYRIKTESAREEVGQPITGTIVESRKYGSGKFTTLKIKVEFSNFSQTTVTEEFRFADSRADENRYELGNRVSLLLIRDDEKGPSIKLASGQNRTGPLFFPFSIALISGAAYGTWYLYNLTMDASAGDWNLAVDKLSANPEITLMGIIFLGSIGIQQIVFKRVGKLISPSKKVSHRELQFYGKKAQATILSYKDTNMSINDNPVVQFDYTFTDHHGREHRGQDKSVVGKLEIALLPTTKEKEIIYLPENPAESLFTENLKPSSVKGCLSIVLLFEAFIFSAILLGSYIAALSL